MATEGVYKTKVVQFLGRSTPILLQNDHGPCPLLAICNVLLLRNVLKLSLDTSEVSLQKLLSLVKERLIYSNSNVQGRDERYDVNQQQNIADAIDLLPRLATGIDVNVRFKRISDFEFTPERALFDLLDIGLYHGWIVDHQDTDTATAIGSKSYNTLVDEVVRNQCNGQLIKNFLENNASQLTIDGLFCLQEGLKERKLCVFFRNNHFFTMFKLNGELYLLVTDQGYINQPDLVWEKLNDVNGDTVFMTGNFTEFKAENQVSESWNEQNAMTNAADYQASLKNSPSSATSNSDMQLAVALQQEEFEQQPPVSGHSRPVTYRQDYRASLESSPSSSTLTSDMQLAVALQEEEFEQQPPIIGRSRPVAHHQDYRASLESSSPSSSTLISDLQLAIALQEEEFEQQPPVTGCPRPVAHRQAPRKRSMK